MQTPQTGTHQGNTKWDRLAPSWFGSGSPASPSLDDLEHYRTLVGTARGTDKAALLLGCTPSLRRVLAESGWSVTALDHNPAMLAASEATYLRQTSEQFILGDWLDERPGTFDAIVGDKVFDNVRPSDWGELIVRLGQVLKPAHPLVVRVAPVNRDLLGYTFSDLLQQWARRYECGAVSLEDAAAGLWEEALGASTTALPGLQTVARFTHEIATLRAASLSNWEANVLTQYEVSFGASIDESWTAYTLGALIDALDGFFRLLHVRYSTDYMAAQRQPILAFERRALNTRTEAHT